MSEQLKTLLDILPASVEKIPVPDEKFLCISTPGKIDEECFFGISLKNGVKILSILVLVHVISTFMDILSPGTLLKLLFYIITFVILIVIAVYAYYSAVNDNYAYAKLAYFSLGVVFAYQALVYTVKSALKLLEFIKPWGSDFFNMNILVYILGNGVYLFIILYFVWVMYCYMLSLKGPSLSKIIDIEKSG